MENNPSLPEHSQ